MSIIRYRAHCADLGWQEPVEDGSIAGTIGENRAMEAFRIEGVNIPGVGVHAFALVQDLGWTNGNITGEDVGTTGLGKHLEAVRMGLFGENADKYDIFYRLHVQDRGFMNWSCNGALNGTEGGNVQAEAIQIYIAEKGANKYPATDTNAAFENLTPPAVPIDYRQNLLDCARSYIGYITGTSEDSYFGRYYNSSGNWCDYFVHFCAESVGIPFPGRDLGYEYDGWVPDVEDWARENGRWTYVPEPGFAVLYDFNDNGTPDHIGIVESVIDDDHVIAIEGNTGDPVGVYRRDRSYGIRGYVNLF